MILVLAVIPAFCLLYSGEISKKDPGETLVISFTDFSALADTMNEVISRALTGLGISPDQISSTQPKRRDNGIHGIYTQTRVRAPGNLPFALCNLEVTKAVQRIGGKVIEGKEDGRRNTLTLTVGITDSVTERIVVSKHSSIERLEGKAAIIVDDFGGVDNELSRGFLGLDQSVTIAVLPNLKASKRIAEQAHAKGREVLLHLPMEPHNSQLDPGRGAIFVNLTPDEIKERVRESISSLPHIRGVNNHMGSKATEDETVMEAVLSEVKNQGLFWVDSKTSPNSIAYDAAKAAGMKTAQSRLFLDSEPEVNKIEAKLEQLFHLATTEGHVLAICHCRPLTLQVLRQALPKLEKRGITFVYASELVE